MSGHEKEILTKEKHDALVLGANLLIEELFKDLVRIEKGESISDCDALQDYLPSQFRHYYTGLFVTKFIVCVVRMADRIATWEDGTIPASTAENMALGAIIDKAKIKLELKADKNGYPVDMDYDLFEDVVSPDLDYAILFDPKYDGIEDTQEAEYMGMALKPPEWFEPIYGDVHPYVKDDPKL
ncbi:MAG: hypothetical protein FH756_00170 [Firmicutes bacterium]|nr:hypothetical protein [Bacillota bacterium]